MTLSIMPLNIMTLSIMTLSIMTLRVMTLSMETLSIITALDNVDTVTRFFIVMLSVITECRYAECRGATANTHTP